MVLELEVHPNVLKMLIFSKNKNSDLNSLQSFNVTTVCKYMIYKYIYLVAQMVAHLLTMQETRIGSRVGNIL